MIIKTCFKCSYHTFKKNDFKKESYCQKEGCYAAYTKCIAKKALEKFYTDEKIEFIEGLKTEVLITQ
jgi:hypothetical protein